MYKYAISPKIKIYLANNPILNLGKTTGIETQINISKKINYNYTFGFFYRYSYWHINKSNSIRIVYNNTFYSIFEPESKTKNQYIGIYLEKSF